MGHPTPKTSTWSQGPSPADAGQIAQGTQAGQAYANTPLMNNPYIAQGIGGYQNAANAGNLGLGALTGDQGAYNQLANPYQNQVLQQLQQQFGFQNQGVLNQAADQAQGQNAYGGTRSNILAGTALSQNQMGQNQQYGNTLLQGYNDTMNRAGNLAAMGQNADTNLSQFGNADAAHQFQALAQTFGAFPHGTQGTGTETPSSPGAGQKAIGDLLQAGGVAAKAWGNGG